MKNFTTNHHEPSRTKIRYRSTGSLCSSGSWLIILFIVVASNLYAQRDDSEVAQQYVQWVQQAIDEGRWHDAYTALVRVSDFETVSSDISYLIAITNNHYGADRVITVEHLNRAIETNRWTIYSVNHALLLKAEQLIAMRFYTDALNSLDLIIELGDLASNAQMRADAFMLRLLALRGGISYVQVLEQFRSQVLSAMDRFPRDPRPLRIFFEYAASVSNRMPELSGLQPVDEILLEFAFRRLPFMLETDPELAWMAAPFMSDTEAARRLVASYRAGGIPHIRNRDFMPHPGSIPVALNLGLLDDFEAVEELFSGSRGFNHPLPPNIIPDGNPVLEKNIVADTYYLLRSEEGRNFFSQKLLSFTGIIFTDDDNDGFVDSRTHYNSGLIQRFELDRNQRNIFDLQFFMNGGVPVNAIVRLTGQDIYAHVNWERYPSVEKVILESPLSSGEIFLFGPADFQYAPVAFTEFGGSNNLGGLLFPVPALQFIDITFRSLLYFCSSLTRSSLEINGAMETIYMNRGVMLQAIETLNDRQVSVTEFERGLPVIQYIDLDLDGRMETIRRFRTLNTQDIAVLYEYALFDYRKLIISSESDWGGDGRFKTMEVYLDDGTVVYYFDMDGSGEWTYIETRNQ